MKRILLAEDDLELIRVLSRVLCSEGYAVRVLEDGGSVLQLCRDQRPDLVIADIHMPIKGGEEVISDLRRDFPMVKIIAMSGDAEACARLATARTPGADEICLKPFTPDQILEAVTRVLS